ncbi:EAL domain-containing protein [Pantoea sp. CS_6]|uniref:EAL domain-containing protein n=1 Tax=Pantoea sp. CS_6 TaxID=3055795 RepID=UPI0035C2694F
MLSDVEGIRFQPLVALKTGEIIGCEVLSSVKNNNPGKWFSELSSEKIFSLFLWQMEYLAKFSGEYWLNLPVKIFCNASKIKQLLNINHDSRIILEVQDPEKLPHLSWAELNAFEKGIAALRLAGWSIWLDDITSTLIPLISKMPLQVNGIKIDRNEIKDPGKIVALISKASVIYPHILVEGIETQKDKQCILLTHAQYGQGFLWPERKVLLTVSKSIY